MAFNEQLTKLRKRNNITQMELAEKMGVKQYIISYWEIGRSEPNIEQIIKLSDVLCVPTDYLLDRPVIRPINEEDFNNVVENIKKDMSDDFMNEIKKTCDNLPQKKKDIIINIVKEIAEY